MWYIHGSYGKWNFNNRKQMDHPYTLALISKLLILI